jgi:NADPH:quinone reductase
MRALRCLSYGSPEDLVLDALEDPPVPPGGALVDVRAAAVNYPDVLIVANRYQVSVQPPFTPGSEFAGVVVEVAEGVTNVKPGDEVMGVAFVGAFAERIAVDAAALTPVPEGMSFIEASAVQVTYQTALSALRSVADAQSGEWVVVLGAVGGVGSAAVDVARRLDCRVVACVSNAERADTARDWGADAVIDYGSEDLKTAIRDATGDGADVVIDPVGGALAEPALRALRRGGRFVTVGYAGGDIPRIPLNLVLLKGITIAGFEMRGFAEHEPERAAADRDELRRLIAGGLRPRIGEVFPLKHAAEALQHVADRQAVGKTVIEMVPA